MLCSIDDQTLIFFIFLYFWEATSGNITAGGTLNSDTRMDLDFQA